MGEHEQLMQMALSQYVGMRCIHCDRLYSSVKLIRACEVVRADTDEFKICCKLCYDLEDAKEVTKHG